MLNIYKYGKLVQTKNHVFLSVEENIELVAVLTFSSGLFGKQVFREALVALQ